LAPSVTAGANPLLSAAATPLPPLATTRTTLGSATVVIPPPLLATTHQEHFGLGQVKKHEKEADALVGRAGTGRALGVCSVMRMPKLLKKFYLSRALHF
jgi:hypothetical protein